jgi:hypothetical protein
MLLTGVVAGVTAWFWAPEKQESSTWLKYLLIGVVASFTVPLFLATISSTLIVPQGTSTQVSPTSYLVFAGLCLLVAFYAPSYLNKLSERILSQLQETRKETKAARQATEEARIVALEAKEEFANQKPVIDALLASQTEPDEEDDEAE